MSATSSTRSTAPQTQHRLTYPVLIAIAHVHHASAWSVTCESITHRLANQCQEHQHIPAAPTSTVHTAHKHSHNALAYLATCVPMETCGGTPPAVP
ncbi:unnamed protein product [Schistocephalus solidus]|uniref:Secreted protein n=1 Tax=Schistocephalus solidus TaxID=70667 RepID=A0A183SE17_SCHSO|nr:unnamed protein product [Schistocephalus solidus]